MLGQGSPTAGFVASLACLLSFSEQPADWSAPQLNIVSPLLPSFSSSSLTSLVSHLAPTLWLSVHHFCPPTMMASKEVAATPTPDRAGGHTPCGMPAYLLLTPLPGSSSTSSGSRFWRSTFPCRAASSANPTSAASLPHQWNCCPYRQACPYAY